MDVNLRVRTQDGASMSTTKTGEPAPEGRRADDAPADDGIAAPHSRLPQLEEPKVTTLELFFDLVFVFALTQVTALLAEELTWTNMLRGLAVLAVIWWSWVGFSWMTNYVKADDGLTRLSMFASMGAVLVLSLATPRAFTDWGVQFGVAYLVLTLLFLLTYGTAARGEPAVLGSILRLAPGMLVAPVLVLIAGFLDEGALRATLWGVAIVVAFASGLISGTSGWKLSPSHFTERHGLVIIIALGESIVSIGVGAASGDDGLSAIVIAGSLLALVIACCLWWLYFDVVALVAERRLHAAQGAERNAIARDSYSYLHYLLMAGIILVALGIKKVLIYVDKPLPTVALAALLGGLALYLVGHVLFRLRNIRSWNVQRLVVAAVLVALIPVLANVAAWQVLVLATVVMVALVAYEARHFAAARHEVRHHHVGAPGHGHDAGRG
jgi:low temperature requirement protein LtrA